MILFVGDRPSPKMKPGAEPFEGASCEKRLKLWIKAVGVQPYYLINSVDEGFWPLVRLFQATKVPMIALGNKASIKLGSTPHFKLPHPSGQNRQINDKAFIENKLKECKEWIKAQS